VVANLAHAVIKREITHLNSFFLHLHTSANTNTTVPTCVVGSPESVPPTIAGSFLDSIATEDSGPPGKLTHGLSVLVATLGPGLIAV
jgi:hypothetical protein